MKILMKETRRGSEDGKIVRRFYENKIYDISDTLAQSFIRNKWAECIEGNGEREVLSAVNDRIFAAFGMSCNPVKANKERIIQNPLTIQQLGGICRAMEKAGMKDVTMAHRGNVEDS
ncbi:MAG: hypothetical protein KGL39_40000 [Patescibacteria group bacterium]|nr:hypothetical protein [Patescibacteria group bacterium]